MTPRFSKPDDFTTFDRNNLKHHLQQHINQTDCCSTNYDDEINEKISEVEPLKSPPKTSYDDIVSSDESCLLKNTINFTGNISSKLLMLSFCSGFNVCSMFSSELSIIIEEFKL